eukprot:2099582-Amphidinium_carterae.1
MDNQGARTERQSPTGTHICNMARRAKSSCFRTAVSSKTWESLGGYPKECSNGSGSKLQAECEYQEAVKNVLQGNTQGIKRRQCQAEESR